MRAASWAVAALIAVSAGSPPAAMAQVQFDYTRAMANYNAVLSGTKRLADLTPGEQQEVLYVHRLLSRSDPPDDADDECRESWRDAKSAKEELLNRARRLVRCAEGSDLEDDCDSEFSSVRSAHSDYDSRSSDVESDC